MHLVPIVVRAATFARVHLGTTPFVWRSAAVLGRSNVRNIRSVGNLQHWLEAVACCGRGRPRSGGSAEMHPIRKTAQEIPCCAVTQRSDSVQPMTALRFRSLIFCLLVTTVTC